MSMSAWSRAALACSSPASRPRRRGRLHRGLAAAALAGLLALTACGGSDGDVRTLPAATQSTIDDAVRAHLASTGAPGAVVWVDIGGQGRYAQAYGTADLDTGAPRTVTDPFRIASITKTFTATAVLQLVAQGKLKLDDPLATWYPDFPNADRITVDDLLRMRSGIADSADEDFLAEYYADPLLPVTAEDMIARSAARADAFEAPDTRTVYTNVNFMLLERIAVKVDGRPLEAQLAERVYAPLGMRETRYPDARDTTVGGHTRGYSYEAATGTYVDKTVLNPEPPGGAGAMISTLEDLHRYVRGLCTDSGLVPSDLYRQRLEGATIDGAADFVRYGAGVERLAGFCGHNGTIMGFSSEMFYLPARDAVILIDVNRLDADDRSQSGALFARLAKDLFPDDVPW